MGPPNESPKSSPDGFEGAIAGLGLSDVIELNANNRFSGCVQVQCDISTGLVFFREGEIIHAEVDGRSGEEAFYEIMRWPSGSFSLQPNVATTRHSIERGWRFLLMEANRLLDERRAGHEPAPVRAEPGDARTERQPGFVERVRRIPGVAYAVLLGKDGQRVGDDSYEAETLEGQTVYLTMVGHRLGEIFRTGEVLAAVVQGTEQHLLLLASKQHNLSILVKGEAHAGAVEAEIRKLLGAKR